MVQWSLARWPENEHVDLSKDLVQIKEEIVKLGEAEVHDAVA